MDNYNIRQDRPRLSSEEIAQQKDFDSILNDYHIIKKPFYKNPWFFGVTGMASVGLLIGTSLSFTDKPAEPPLAIVTTENEPPKKANKTIYLASMEANTHEITEEVMRKKENIQLKKKEIHDNTSTLNKNSLKTPASAAENTEVKQIDAIQKATKVNSGHSNALQNHPKINGKIGGTLSLDELKNDFTITTDSNIPIIAFEMHLATEFGSKVYRSKSNQLTSEMIDALTAVSAETEVYFQGIKGQLNEDFTKNLQPLKFKVAK